MKKIFLASIIFLFLTGAGCVVSPAQKDWRTITIGGVVTFQIPPNCNAEGAAGSTYITCPTASNESPVPEFVFSSDAIQVNMKRWENKESPYWNDVVASLKVISPLKHAIQINIE